MISNMKPCNIIFRSLIIARLSESNKTTVQILKRVAYILVYKQWKEYIHVTTDIITFKDQRGNLQIT
jgi:hypothetical protein